LSERFVFKVKKLPNEKQDFKTVKSKAQNQKKKTVTAEKVLLVLLRRIH
jgi:hypothetical protein